VVIQKICWFTEAAAAYFATGTI